MKCSICRWVGFFLYFIEKFFLVKNFMGNFIGVYRILKLFLFCFLMEEVFYVFGVYFLKFEEFLSLKEWKYGFLYWNKLVMLGEFFYLCFLFIWICILYNLLLVVEVDGDSVIILDYCYEVVVELIFCSIF